ncbi:MAG TPA: 30S ribosomal protein S3ae [Thermoplasmata archaeon]|nr:30S ribosomal protein S3ae [Thermoplasmata archaeon]
MSTKAKAVASARKMKDRWRAKQWYRIMAPEMFNMALLGETPADNPESLKGRTMEATVQDLTGDFSKMHIKLKFQVHDVRGLDAHTLFIGHDLTNDYVRRQTRRKRSKTDAVVEVTTKDGWRIKVKPMAVAEQRIQSSQETAIRHIMEDVIIKAASGSTVSEFVKLMVGGELSKEIADKGKVVVPMKRIEIRKSQVLAFGEVPEIKEEAAQEAPATEVEAAPAAAEAPADEVVAPEPSTEESEELSEEDLAKEAGGKEP